MLISRQSFVKCFFQQLIKHSLEIKTWKSIFSSWHRYFFFYHRAIKCNKVVLRSRETVSNIGFIDLWDKWINVVFVLLLEPNITYIMCSSLLHIGNGTYHLIIFGHRYINPVEDGILVIFGHCVLKANRIYYYLIIFGDCFIGNANRIYHLILFSHCYITLTDHIMWYSLAIIT